MVGSVKIAILRQYTAEQNYSASVVVHFTQFKLCTWYSVLPSQLSFRKLLIVRKVFCMLQSGGFIYVYRFLDGGRNLELVHKTQVEGIPMAVAAFKGKLVAGIGTSLRMYELGKKKLLRKCEYRK